MLSAILDVALIILGITLLAKGASLFIDSSVAAARSYGVSQHVIGVTLVAFATSLPELAVSSIASWQGSGGLALGNVIGSNVANITLAIGITALIFPILCSRRSITDAVIMLIATLLMWIFMFTGGLVDRWEGVILLILYVAFLIYVYKRTDSESIEVVEEEGELGGWASKERPAWIYSMISIFMGLVVVIGAQLMVKGASGLASQMGISDLIIGSTIVAIGTSLPEITASLAAGLKKKHGIALGNVLGSNIMNILIVLGASAAIAPISVGTGSAQDNMMWITMPFLVIVTALTIPMALQKKVGKKAAIPLVVLYVVFLFTLWSPF